MSQAAISILFATLCAEAAQAQEHPVSRVLNGHTYAAVTTAVDPFLDNHFRTSTSLARTLDLDVDFGGMRLEFDTVSLLQSFGLQINLGEWWAVWAELSGGMTSNTSAEGLALTGVNLDYTMKLGSHVRFVSSEQVQVSGGFHLLVDRRTSTSGLQLALAAFDANVGALEYGSDVAVLASVDVAYSPHPLLGLRLNLTPGVWHRTIRSTGVWDPQSPFSLSAELAVSLDTTTWGLPLALSITQGLDSSFGESLAVAQRHAVALDFVGHPTFQVGVEASLDRVPNDDWNPPQTVFRAANLELRFQHGW